MTQLKVFEESMRNCILVLALFGLITMVCGTDSVQPNATHDADSHDMHAAEAGHGADQGHGADRAPVHAASN